MSSKTKIVVIHMKELIIGVVIAVAVIILLIFTIVALNSKSKSNNVSGPVSNKATSSTNIKNTYNPGVYTTSVSLNGNPVDIKVTVDNEKISNIEMVNLSEAVTTMYPLIQDSFNELTAEIIANGSTENITYESDNKYTSTMFLNAIQAALDKAKIQ